MYIVIMFSFNIVKYYVPITSQEAANGKSNRPINILKVLFLFIVFNFLLKVLKHFHQYVQFL